MCTKHMLKCVLYFAHRLIVDSRLRWPYANCFRWDHIDAWWLIQIVVDGPYATIDFHWIGDRFSGILPAHRCFGHGTRRCSKCTVWRKKIGKTQLKNWILYYLSFHSNDVWELSNETNMSIEKNYNWIQLLLPFGNTFDSTNSVATEHSIHNQLCTSCTNAWRCAQCSDFISFYLFLNKYSRGFHCSSPISTKSLC